VTLAEWLARASVDLPGVETVALSDGSLVWSRAGRPFATVTADGAAEFGLEPSVAEAAARTPDATISSRGPGWVRLAPTELDDQTIDRAVAWLASAYRRLSPRD
jgi:hypothetical protein